MSMSSDEANLGLQDSLGHSEWSIRMCERLNKELHSVKRQNQELKNAYDMSVRDYKLACDARNHTQSQLNLVKTDMDSLKVHSNKMESENNLYKQQLMERQAHHDNHRHSQYGSSEMLKEMYDSQVDLNNSMKNQLDYLSKMHEAKCEELTKMMKERNQMQTLRAQCTAATQEWHRIAKENVELEETIRAVRHDKEKFGKDLANIRKTKDHEVAILRREKEELSKNHNLVMSERDNVHKEIDMLTERISEANNKINQLEQEKRQNSDMIVTYRHEIQSALHDRDQAQKQMRELKECVGQMLKESDNTEMDTTLRNRLLDVSRTDRNEVNEDRSSRGSRLPPPPYDMKESANDSHSSKECEMLKKEISSLRNELTEAKKEAGISIKRRDWAFSERDKIVQERESIRRQCDELRRERDRAVSNHAEELRTLDELKRFKIATSKELEDMREKLEKEERKNQLIGQSNSRDSAIDNDFQDWDTETLDYEIDVSGGYHSDLGIDISYGGGDASEASLYVNSIMKGSPCEGKLRVNDVLLRVNDVDVANASKETVMEALRAASNTVNLKIRRKKPIGRFNVSVDLTLNKRDPGLQLESGVYISKISPGSVLAKEGNIAVGDRVLSVNNKSVEHKTAKDVMKMIEGSGDYVKLNVGKYGIMPSDSTSNTSPNSGSSVNQGIFEKWKNRFRNPGSEKTLSKHGIDNGTGTTKRHKAPYGQKQLTSFINRFKNRSGDDDDDESDTLKVRTENVIQILDQINRDADGTGTWPRGTEGVEVSTNGTVTNRPRPHNKPVIPETFVNHDQIYNRHRHSSDDRQTDSRSSQQQTRHSYIPPSHSQSPVDRMGITSPHHHTPLYEPKVQTLPNNGPRRYVSKETAEKSKSLESHTSASRQHRHGSQPAFCRPFYPPNGSEKTDESAKSLDIAVEVYKKKYDAGSKHETRKPRPISLQPQFVNKSMSPHHDPDKRMPSSPLRKTNRPFTPESPMSVSSSYRFAGDSRPGSAAGQPTATRSYSSGQMFSPAPSTPHRIVNPSCSPPPPYSSTDHKMIHNSPSSILEDHYHRESNRASPVPTYQSQTLDRKFAPGSSHIHHAVPARPSSSTDYSTARVKFPSNHSVSSNRKSLNSNSLEVVSSGRSSPLSSPFSPPDYYNRRSEEFINSTSSRPSSGRSTKPKEGVLREVELDTSFDHLGIQIQEHPGTGIFITSVSHNSLAAEVGIEVDDQIIEFCGINMRTASYQDAASVLKSWRYDDDVGKVKMTVQYNPKRCKHFPEQPKEVDKNSVTGSIQAIHVYMENNGPHNKRPLNIVHSNGSSSDESRADPPRNIYCQRTTQDVGIKLCGGNATGVFVANISQDSPCANTDLKTGDQILAINGKDLQHATAEQVATELNRPSESLHITAQNNLNKYRMIHTGGDHFYVRAHFSYEAENQNELSISPGDLLLVENSLLYGQIGKWYVSKIDERDNRLTTGIVPSRIKMEESYSLRRSYSDVMPDDDSKSVGKSRNGSIGRRSFFKRRSGRHQHQRSGSKDSRELTSFSDLSMSSDNVPIADDGAPLLYQRVEKIHCTYPRPVIILGPFAQALIQKLVHESPDKYVEYEGELLNTAENTVIERGIADGVFVDYKKVNDLFEVTRTEKLRDVARSGHHCLLMVHPSAVERMHRRKLYPIVIFIKHKSQKQIKEVKDPRFLPDHVSSRSAKELFDHFSKIEVEFKIFFTVEVQGSNMAAMHQNIKRTIDEEQGKNLWL